MYRLTSIFLALYFCSPSNAQDAQPHHNYFILEKIAATQFKDLGLVPGVYLTEHSSVDHDPKDLVLKDHWVNIFEPGKDVDVAISSGSISNTNKEVWARYQDRNYLLVAQTGNPQIVLQAVPRLIVPAKGGFFVFNNKFQPYFFSNEIKQVKGSFSYQPSNLPRVVSSDGKIDARHYTLTQDGLGLIYYTQDKEVCIFRIDGTITKIDFKDSADITLAPGGIYTTNSEGTNSAVDFTEFTKEGDLLAKP